MRKPFPTLLFSVVLWASCAQALQETARVDQGVLPLAPTPKCALIASPPNIEMSSSSDEIGYPYSTIVLVIPPTSGPINSATLYRRNLRIPTTLPGMICGGGNPPTVTFANDPARVPIGTITPRVPGSKSFGAFQIQSQYAQFTADIVGPGGAGSCAVTVTTSCAPYMTSSHSWTNESGRYASFNFDDGIFITNNDAPRCTWSLCQVDGYGNHHPGCCGNRGDEPGCFDPMTKLRMADGTSKRAHEIIPGDKLWNPSRKQGMRVKKVIAGPEKKPLIELGFGDHFISVSSMHPMRTKTGIKAAIAITKEDWLLGADEKFHPVSKIETLPVRRGQLVYNFELETKSSAMEDHLLVAEGIVTGDYFLQSSLEKQTLP